MPSAVTLIRSTSLSSVAEYAYAATASAGARLIVLAGACPLKADGSTAAPGDYAGQAAKAAENMRTALADAGVSVDDVLCTGSWSRPAGERTWSQPGRWCGTRSATTMCPVP